MQFIFPYLRNIAELKSQALEIKEKAEAGFLRKMITNRQ
jgi:hypothetical protein